MMLIIILGSALILSLGIFMFLKPETVWYLTESWKSYSADGPSDLYLKLTRISGALIMAGSVLMAVLPLILE